MTALTFQKELFRSKCSPNSESVHCVAHLDQDISEILPYLNTTLGGADYITSPPSLTLKRDGKSVILHAREIFISAVKDDEEADTILEWLQKQILETWEKRDEIEPTFDPPPAPEWLKILKLLPKTNCNKCGQPTCTVFALNAAKGAGGPENCPDLTEENKIKLSEYLRGFRF